MKYFIGADLGTSALKLLLVDDRGKILKTVSKSYPLSYPEPGWSEQNPEDWWEAFSAGIKEITDGVEKANITGIGLGGQMHGLVVLDKTDAVIRPAILWNDGRTDKETAYLNETVGKEKLSELTANIAFAGFTAPKIMWLKNNEPENFARVSKIMLPKDYINYRLTGVHGTDYSDASGMLLLDVKNRCWSKEMLDICGVSEQRMPCLFESYEPVGWLLPDIADMLGLPSGITVVAGAGDNAAAAVGTGTVSDGACNISLGTSGTVFISSNTFSVDPCNALHAFCHADGGYHLMGCILSAASCNQWFCEDILKSGDYAGEQASITDEMLGANHVFFLPYLMGERSPINDTDARGAFVGMRMDTKRAEMVQAVLEGVAFAIRDNVEIARAQGLKIEESCLCGGGAQSGLWRKILCNVLNIKITLPQTEQGPGYGAAMLAMVGTGAFETVKDCSDRFAKIKSTLIPEAEDVNETNRRLDEISDYILEKMQATGIKCLWGTANMFSNPRFMNGAGSTNAADVYCFAAAQIKKALELTVKFGGKGYVFWGGREGYETLLNTDMKFEQENIARLMHMAVDYGRSIGFQGDFYIEPKPKEPMKHQYDFDAATAIGFLRRYGLERDFKMNVEANHATLAGHTFQHELRVSAINSMLGSIDANQGDLLLGWDTDEFPANVYDTTLCMYEVLKAGGLTGGFNFDAKNRRPSYTPEDLVCSFVLGMDTFALGLIKAAALIEDGRIDEFVSRRYASYRTGIGAKIVSGETTLEELADYAAKLGAPELPGSGRQEYLESVVNQILFG